MTENAYEKTHTLQDLLAAPARTEVIGLDGLLYRKTGDGWWDVPGYFYDVNSAQLDSIGVHRWDGVPS
jgi:hypothetical protein